MAFSEELKAFQDTHPFSTASVDGIEVNYLLCGNESSNITLVYLVGGTGFSVVWADFLHSLLCENIRMTMRLTDSIPHPPCPRPLSRT